MIEYQSRWATFMFVAHVQIGTVLPRRERTPNCPMCSRQVEHAECVVLHLQDDRWVADRHPAGSSEPTADAADADVTNDQG